MELMSAIMLTIIAVLVCLNLPRIYGDWLEFKRLAQEGATDELRSLLDSENLWVQRHFWCSVAGVCMVIVFACTSLADIAPHLSQVTAAYTGISLLFAFVESVFAQKIASIPAVAQEVRRDPQA